MITLIGRWASDHLVYYFERVRLLFTRLLLSSLLLVANPVVASAELSLSDFSVKGLFEVQLPVTDSLQHPPNGTGKFRFDESDNGRLLPASNGVEIHYQIASTSQLKGVVLYNQDPDHDLALTELYWHKRPLPRGSIRSDYKLGAFYPPVSLEHVAPLWTSPYTITPSVLNSWVGEELRTVGVQGKWTWMGRHRGSPHDFSVTAALFGGNDSTGALIAWRGWVRTDRQTGLGGSVSIGDLPTFRPGMPFEKQDPDLEPFIEVDDRPGFYIAANWNYQKRIKMSLLYYDNQADPGVVEDGQYGWHTHFGHASLRLQLAKDLRLLGQVMSGSTRMGPDREVNAPFYASYVMLIKSIDQHRLSLQLEEFFVHDDDKMPMDANNERGKGVTLAWSYRPKKQWQFTTQYSWLQSDRDQRRYFGEARGQNESQLLGSARYYW